MSLLDGLIANVLAKVAGDRGPALKDFLQDNGGISGLSQKFQNGGLGELFGSWVGTGDNQLITPAQIEAVMGNAKVQAFADLLGIDTTKATEFLATTLPALVDKLTPDGKIPEEEGAAAAAAPQVPAAPLAPEKENALLQFLKDNGGVAGLYEKFRNGGLAREFASWVSTGANELITPAQIEAVMGNDRVQALAKLLGIDTTQATEFLARTLPALVDRLTPDGKIPGEGAVVASEVQAVAPAAPAGLVPPATPPGQANA
jgi:uncharacterized protein YidB (DUF937 family)